MSDTATEQLRRLLALVPELADGEEHPIARVAARVGTEPRSVVADLTTLVERFDAPGGFVGPVSVYLGAGPESTVQLRTDHFLRPMRLTGAELQALELGLAVLAGERPPEEQPAIADARARLASVLARLPADDGVPVGAAGTPGALAAELAPLDANGRAHLAVLRDARRDRRPVRLTYRRSGATASTDRTVCPYALVVASGAWYVIAWCLHSAGLRVFRLDRIEGAEAAGAEADPFTVPDDFDPGVLMRDGRVFAGGEPAPGEPPATLVVRYGPAVARWIVEREGGTPAADGSLVVERPLADVEWALRHVLQYGPDAEVLAPAAVRAVVAARLDAMLG